MLNIYQTYSVGLILGHGEYDAEQAVVGVVDVEAGGGEGPDVADGARDGRAVRAPLRHRPVAESCNNAIIKASVAI